MAVEPIYLFKSDESVGLGAAFVRWRDYNALAAHLEEATEWLNIFYRYHRDRSGQVPEVGWQHFEAWYEREVAPRAADSVAGPSQFNRLIDAIYEFRDWGTYRDRADERGDRKMSAAAFAKLLKVFCEIEHERGIDCGLKTVRPADSTTGPRNPA